MNGLIIKKPWIDLILNYQKIWEIRGQNTKIRGKIKLIESGTGCVVGECELVNCIALNEKTFFENESKHLIKNKTLPYKKNYAWEIKNPKRYLKKEPYSHPRGAIIWVKL